MNNKEKDQLNNEKQGLRQQGSTVAAYILGVILIVLAIYLFTGGEVNWVKVQRFVNGATCAVFALTLFLWARSKDWTTEHHQKSIRKIGFETITMLVTIVTAVIAILTLTDAASRPSCGCSATQTISTSR
jgi:Kef-type K+ transport system membrane component KefB